jgi:hypothetical protein
VGIEDLDRRDFARCNERDQFAGGFPGQSGM